MPIVFPSSSKQRRVTHASAAHNTGENMSDLYPLFETLQSLTAIPSTSGFEQGVVKKLYQEFKPFADKVEVDYFGNIYAYLLGASETFRILLPAHSDSVGMIVSHIEENGYIRFDPIGAVPPNLTYAQRVLISTPLGEKIGVVASKPGHLAFLDPELGMRVPAADALFIDVGATSRNQAEAMGIAPGQQVTFDRELKWLGDASTGLVTGRALDDKVGCLVLLETLKRLKKQGKKPPATLIFNAAVQEEVGLRGAYQSGERIKPALCIGIDATISQAGWGTGVAAMPEISFSEAANALRGGPGISINDMSRRTGAGLLGHPKITGFLQEVAKKHQIRYQIEGSMPNITSDAAAVQYAGSGVPSVTVKIPSRYTHGPIEVASLQDIEDTIALLVQALPQIGPDFDLRFVELE
jgi:endoglucanase